MNFIYNVAKEALMEGNLNFLTATMRCLALTSAANENKDHTTVAAVVAADTEVTGGLYARQGLSSVTVVADNTDDEGVFDAGDITFPGVATGQDIVALLIYKFVTDDAGSMPVFWIDTATGLPLTANDGNVTVSWPAEGIFNLNDA